MNHWVETPYGKRYQEDHGTSIAFFMTTPDEDGNRVLPDVVVDIILEGYMHLDQWREE
ncbi:hypothetical protein [Marinisporobacter balticus]|uniref:Uncharacterized protein n=1 Tax=Marinisporobacter balticus TaxID=2018667 RepID=A0A4R2K8R1_9FIRM|nr:hypothetical protein [Marinisporobacter balticus]TCO68492.1 hypothetical protein EV214_14414 [Marinisporobacter balticus]